MITLQETRPRGDRDVPIVLRDGALYDVELDRFMRDLPANGARSRHTLRAYGYDIMLWARFLDEARAKTIWRADRDDVTAYHRARRRSGAHTRISAASWNRAIASLDKLYAWALDEALVTASPFRRRTVWRRGRGGRGGQVVGGNLSYESTPKRADIALVTMPEFRRFCDVGLRGFTAGGDYRPGARDRNGGRNALFAELLFASGLRLEEASALFAFEMTAPPPRGPARLRLGTRLTKGDKGRTVIVPRSVITSVRQYIELERAIAVAAFRTGERWRSIDAILCRRPSSRTHVLVAARRAERISLDELTPDERLRIVLVDVRGRPLEPAALWLSEIGLPLAPNSWEKVFERARRRCAAAKLRVKVTPHQLRHAFAVHMLAMLIRKTIVAAGADDRDPSSEAYRRLLGDPLHTVQRLLGHSSLETTYLYLNHLAGLQDTVDQAVEELLGPSVRAAA
ncbi:MAG: site-specific integrase [Hyphomonadaceae bacterium]|nr:site-specific integrase [Hyphomonadaceae bacterium]